MKSSSLRAGIKARPLLSQIQARRGLGHDAQQQSSSSSATTPGVIFSGIQPTGVPHLGNYLGALQQWRRMQDSAAADTKLLFSIVDLHAITMPRPRGLLRQWKREMFAALLAIGLDPSRSIIFYQSMVPAHSELQWILSCTASTGYLNRMTQWKSKLSLKDNVSLSSNEAKQTLKHGLFSYPILQAADILVHRATHVPVGEDQRQHLEFARECVTNFNHTYGTSCLVAPETILSPVKRVMSLRSPLQKMSKSDADATSRILLTDSAHAIKNKVLKAVTDSQDGISYDPVGRPGVSNLVELASYFDAAGRTPEQLVEAEFGAGVSLKALKNRVAEAVDAELAPIRERYAEYLAKGELIDRLVEEGAEKARESAEGTMRLVREAVELGA
ncbi:hypothetical protein B0T17DRAFT_526647 [Bombardia bombarda]|uniref:Tryptophan--tRNA ligase, mitochondrial n=1 Tax=Bombardia bombarda TaxID=252184 RepID=A0AA39X9I3_9PEZI|nr:hypothetical protein B0T17DRAFT_526647 [Bombardia bombarda]